MSKEFPLYSIQKTYILNVVSKSEREIVTCDQRIDIPTIEPLTMMIRAVINPSPVFKIIPCIELAGDFLAEFDLKFETNEGVTVLPVKIPEYETPYQKTRYVLVLPRGATGIKSCKLTRKPTGIEVQHNFTFGIMPPPYNYDNALFAYLFDVVALNYKNIKNLRINVTNLEERVTALENKAGG